MPEQKAAFEKLSAEQVTIKELAGEEIHAILTDVPGSSAPVGGSRVMPESGWFTARQSGTEVIYKAYAESFQGLERLRRIQEEAQRIVQRIS